MVLNLWLIPLIGIQGAAVATFASCFLVFFIRLVNARRLLPFPLSGGKLLLGIGVLLMQTAFMLFRWPNWILAQGIGLGILLILGLPSVLSTVQSILQRK